MTVYTDLMGNVLTPQAPQQPARKPSATGRRAISTVTARELDNYIANASPDELLDAIDMERNAETPRKSVLARLNKAVGTTTPDPVVTSTVGPVVHNQSQE